MRLRSLLALICVCFAASPGAAQTATAAIRGTVVDPAGAVVPGAAVRLYDRSSALSREQTSGATGGFVFALVPPGVYELEASLPGFATAHVPAFVLNVGDQRVMRVALGMASLGDTVEVTAPVPRFQASGTNGTVINREFVENIPLSGRSFQSLLTLTPGVVPMTATNFRAGQFSVNGQRDSANYFTVDGVSANTGVLASGANLLGAVGDSAGYNALGSTSALVSLEALEEFRIQTSSFAPEFGRTPGGQVSLVTRSGTNQLRGSGFDYFRSDRFDANDWFANRAGTAKPELSQQQFGGSLGGAIDRDHVFFFGSFERLRLRLPTTRTFEVPSNAARATATGTIQAILKGFPAPTGRDFGNGLAEYVGAWSDPSESDSTSVRVDARAKTLTVFSRYAYAPSFRQVRATGASPASTFLETSFDSNAVTVGSTWLPKASLGNDLRVNYTNNAGDGVTRLDDFDGAIAPDTSLIVPSGLPNDRALITMFLTSASTPSYTLGSNGPNSQRQINIVDTLSFVRSTHAMKAGADYRWMGPTFGGRGYQQTIQFPNVASMIAGQTTSVSVSAFRPLYPRFMNLSLFAQDAWTASPRLTITYGIRYEINPAPGERDGRLPQTVVGLDNLSTMTVAPAGTVSYETSWGNVAPRAGFAYRVSDEGATETVVRGGAGIFYHVQSGSFGTAYDAFAYPNIGTRALGAARYPLTADQASPPPFVETPPYAFINAFPPDLETPYTVQMNATLDRALGAAQSVSIGYVGALGRRLYRREFIGTAQPIFTSFSLTRNLDASDYHALQMQLTRRMSHGLQLIASYTLSKSTDTSSSDTDRNVPAALATPEQDRGPSDFDRRHAFSAAASYHLPPQSGVGRIVGDWTVDVMFRALSAAPVNVSVAVAGRTVRPDLLPGVPMYIDDPTAPGGSRFNDAVDAAHPGCKGPFCTPAANVQGSLGRNVLRGFPLSQLDLALRRDVPLGRARVELRMDTFNILNHPNFADPIGVLTNSLFGRSTSMLNRSIGGLNALYQIGGPRSMQFGARVRF